MENIISKTLSERADFRASLAADLAKNQHVKILKTSEIAKLDDTIKTVRYLGAQPEHSALIPLGRRIYIPGKIVHTGEYLCEKKAHPNSLNVLMTLEQAISALEAKKEEVSEDLDKLMTIERQLEARLDILGMEIYDKEEIQERIVSDKGVAVKLGEFYEIIEFED